MPCVLMLAGGLLALGLAVWSSLGPGDRPIESINRRLARRTGVPYERILRDPRLRQVNRWKATVAALAFAFLGVALLTVATIACFRN